MLTSSYREGTTGGVVLGHRHCRYRASSVACSVASSVAATPSIA